MQDEFVCWPNTKSNESTPSEPSEDLKKKHLRPCRIQLALLIFVTQLFIYVLFFLLVYFVFAFSECF